MCFGFMCAVVTKEALFVMTKTFRKGIESLGSTSIVNLTFVLRFLKIMIKTSDSHQRRFFQITNVSSAQLTL